MSCLPASQSKNPASNKSTSVPTPHHPKPVVLATISLSRSLALSPESDPRPQHTNTIGDIAGLNRLVRFGPFLNEVLWIGADDMRVHKCGSQVGRRVAWVRAWPKNVMCAMCSKGGGDPLHGEATESSSTKEFQRQIHTVDMTVPS